MIALRPKAQTKSRRRAPRAAGALFRRGTTDFFDKKCVDTAVGIVAGDTRKPGIHHHRHSVDG